MSQSLSLFDNVNVEPGSLRGMVQRQPRHTSTDAAAVVEPHRSELQKLVEAAFVAHGPMHDETLENRPEFAGYAPSTVRKRRTELTQKLVLSYRGEARNSRGRKVALWGI